ncbi:MAG: D-amino acid dehydrogenase [Moraxella sp.]|nr:D-amino acid dehydrogenase [Moraxella sp.]
MANRQPTVTVMGAGVTGVATAWYLSRAGFDVTVIDRQPAPALETSFANGGQISVCHATPWANPATPMKAFFWLFKKDAPLLYRLNCHGEQWRFLWRFLQECTAKRADDNLVQLVKLGLYSRQAIKTLSDELDLHFEQRHQGILHFYTNQYEYQSAIAPTLRMQDLGTHRTLMTAKDATDTEPALSALGDKLVGATFTPDDLSGNARLFTCELAKHCKRQGVKFLYNTTINAIHQQNHAISQLILDHNGQQTTHQSEHYVVCLASYGKRLLDKIGMHLPVFPAKGYSATYAIKDPARVPQVSLIDDEYKLVMSRLTSDTDYLRVAGTAEFNGYNTQLDPIRCQAITHRVKALFGDALDYDEPNYWSGQRPMTPSNVPLIGKAHLGNIRHGSHGQVLDNLWLNTGHGTLGFTHACGSALALSLLMSGQTPPLAFDFVGIKNANR